MTGPVDRRPCHQPGMFNIEALWKSGWHGGMNRRTREGAISAAREWNAETGFRYRVFDLDGQVIFDTGSSVTPAGVLATSEDVCRVLQPLFDLGNVGELNGPNGWKLAQLIYPKDAADLTVREVLALLDRVYGGAS